MQIHDGDAARSQHIISAPLRGVSYDKGTSLWRARIYCLGKHVTLGRFSSMQEAAFQHDRAAVFLYGADARTNYGVMVAQEANMRSPPAESWRVMSSLESLSRMIAARRLACASGSVVMTGADNGGNGGNGGNAMYALPHDKPLAALWAAERAARLQSRAEDDDRVFGRPILPPFQQQHPRRRHLAPHHMDEAVHDFRAEPSLAGIVVTSSPHLGGSRRAICALTLIANRVQ